MKIAKAHAVDGRVFHAVEGGYHVTEPPARIQATAAERGISPLLGRILRPAAASRWMLPSVAAITPQYIEMTLRSALAGNHVQQWELFDLMLDTWPELAACAQELSLGVGLLKMIFEP